MAVHICQTLYLPDELIATVRTRVDRLPKGDAIRALANEYAACASGTRRGMARAFVASAVASQTITLDQAAAVNATDTLTIAGGTALAVVASPANENQVSKGASTAAFCTNVVAKINAHSAHSKLVWAAVTDSDGGVITLYAVVPGPIGNLITLAEVGDGFTLTGAALANGASDEVDSYILGYNTPAHVAG